MNRKLMAGLVSVSAFAAITATSMGASLPHWLSDGQPISTKPVKVKTAGTLKLGLTQFGITITCKVKDVEEISNNVDGLGVDEMTVFKLSGCKPPKGTVSRCAPGKFEVIALALPWQSHLAVTSAPGIRDVIEGVTLQIKCSGGAEFGTWSGTLQPKVGNSVLEFEAGEALTSPSFLTVEGTDTLKGPPGDTTITAAP